MGASFEFVKDVIDIKEEKELRYFTGKPKVECVVYAISFYMILHTCNKRIINKVFCWEKGQK